ncbi:MAG: hypothetical protein JEZ00_06955 [Anaerolineaceae bacterium]|nr:hypothetical protein [Anaerolineaceae bacterium]
MRKTLLIRLVSLSFVLLLCLACGQVEVFKQAEIVDTIEIPVGEVVTGGDRILVLDVNELDDKDYDYVLNVAKKAGAQAVTLAVHWDDIETAPGLFNPDPNWLAVANQYYSANEMRVALTIAVIDTNNLRVPADLKDKSFDDPQMITRFNALLDYASTQLPDLKLTNLAIGNEIDIYLGSDAEQWAAYEVFFRETSQHARTLFSGVPIGTKITFENIPGKIKPFAQSINQYSDAVFITYYPLESDFSVRTPQTAQPDFAVLTETFAGQPIYLLEVGYPSGEDNQSSYEMQQQFIHEMFQVWDAHADQIQLISYTWLNDPSEDSVQWLTHYYRMSSKGFISYLATLGLHTNTGEAKPAFQQWHAEVQARGW